MRIIIAPAKKMNIDNDSLNYEELPFFLSEAEILKNKLQNMTLSDLQNLWKCNDNIANLNFNRLQKMSLKENLTPAILAYEGIQYQYMAPSVFEDGHFDFINKHLRILSGFYGLLRPFDGVIPYRLEMQAKLTIGRYNNLYAFWGEKLAKQLYSETDFILNLASKEYSKAIIPFLASNIQLLTITFGELKNEKIIEKGTVCKMARGQMVRWLAENNVTCANDIKCFDQLNYSFSQEYSNDKNLVFLKKNGSQYL